jgi:hypothetical protein
MTQLTEKQQKWLEDLVINGQTTTTEEIIRGLAKITIASLVGGTQLAIEQAIPAEGASVYVLHSFAIQTLAQVLKAYETKDKKTVFDSTAVALEFVKNRPTAVIDEMIQVQTKFEKELKQLITPETLQENFTTTPGTGADSNSTSKV